MAVPSAFMRMLLLAGALCSGFRVRPASQRKAANASLAADPASQSKCGSCSDLKAYLNKEAWTPWSVVGWTDVAIGSATQGTCCRIQSNMGDGKTYLMSASKIISAYTFLAMVDKGVLSLETKAADVFDYWTATDGRKDVTLRHLLSLTAGLTTYPLGLGICTHGGVSGNGTRNCAKYAYENLFSKTFTEPGLEFEYTESTFYVASAMALEVTGLANWDDVFQKFFAHPAGVKGADCKFSLPNKGMAFAGGGLSCKTLEYAKLLNSILGKTLLKDTSLYDEAERPHTLNVKRAPAQQKGFQSCTKKTRAEGCKEDAMPEWGVGKTGIMRATPGVFWHYGLAQWIECATETCQGGILRASSRGALGTYPWVDRGQVSGNPPHWGVIVRQKPIGGPSILAMQKEVLPRAAEVIRAR